MDEIKINNLTFHTDNLITFNKDILNYSEEFHGRMMGDIPVLYGDNWKKIFPELNNLVFDSQKTYKWGHYNERSLYGDQQCELGDTKIYIDTRIKDWYVMWEVTRVDFKELPGIDKEASILGWTPKVINDSVLGAGYRLFWARVLLKNEINEGEFYSSKTLNSEDP